MSPPRASEGHRWQKGEKAERMLLEDVLGGANGKGMVVCVDLFGAVGDRAAAFYNIVRGRGVDANPMAFFFYSLDPAEHCSAVAKSRTVEKAVNVFNTEKLSIAGYVPLPALPPAWEGEAPDHEHVVRMLKESLKVATITNKGEPLIPRDEDVPVDLTADIRETLGGIRKQFPVPMPDPAAQQGPARAGAKKFGSLEELKANMYVATIIA